MASNPGQIPAGGRDKISVVVHTTGKGGQAISKRFRVFTDDPKQPNVELVVSGKVEGFVEIEPNRLSFIGKVGDTLTQEVRITPNAKHPFTIKEASFSEYIQLYTDLKEKPTIGISVHGRLMTPPAESDGKTP
ncbi:MAG: hypothetical protein HZB24_13760 [Desulfobacterales bacterium]|nr:hypothetical protein [Desulfobacterales bacterium]